MQITSAFDSGNIEIIRANRPDDIHLAIRRDNRSDFYQWFHFRLSGVRDTPCTITIDNAGGAAYPDGWRDYGVPVSYDRQNWWRVPTSFDGERLTFSLTPAQDTLWLAYFPPYSMERHQDLIARASADPRVRCRVLGHTLDGQAMDLLELDAPRPDSPVVWLIARQHPGETMAEWWMEGALDALLDPADPISRALLDRAHIRIVPNMNPDGARRGHLRTNAAGVNLNRVWHAPDMATSPEVALVRAEMERTGVDLHMDVHGDEGLPYNFLAGYEGIPGLTADHASAFTDFRTLLTTLSPDFQDVYGYEADAPGTADLTKCTDWTAHRFGCLAMTLEMPFKDNADRPDPTHGWTPDRARHLAKACLAAIHQTLTKQAAP
ncbi:M14 family metallopeptidase [Yunchengibacter salinarum]|uniref:M14 family metallopeptidase n=1 Tax=Yunchengibacter salinarum TaxID=3133399 RepID=UPI0035B66394